MNELFIICLFVIQECLIQLRKGASCICCARLCLFFAVSPDWLHIVYRISCIVFGCAICTDDTMIVTFGINTTSDISKLLYVIPRAVRRGIYARYRIKVMLLFVYFIYISDLVEKLGHQASNFHETKNSIRLY